MVIIFTVGLEIVLTVLFTGAGELGVHPTVAGVHEEGAHGAAKLFQC